LRNREAARYARWSAATAGLIALAVLALYAERSFREAQARRKAPRAVPVSVQQESSQFSFSKEEGNHKLFTVRASHATQYKDQNLAVLEDVWITIYGHEGSRNDNIHTRECSYEPDTGAVRCEGEVQIDIQNAAPGGTAAPSTGKGLEVKTSNLWFDRNTGEASTTAPVEFELPPVQGRGLGASYSSADGIVRVARDVALQMAPSDQTGGMPVTASGSSLEIRRNDRTAVLAGPAIVKEGDRELSADRILVELDADYRARHVVADGHPEVHAAEGRGKIDVSADRFEAFLSGEGWIDRVLADGPVVATRQAKTGTDHFSAGRVEFAMLPARNLVNEMTATQGVAVDSRQASDTQSLKTDAMRVKFALGQAGPNRSGRFAPQSVEHQEVESAETLGPATIESKTDNEMMMLVANKFEAQIGANGHLQKLLGHGGVKVRQVIANGAPQTVRAKEMTASFDSRGQWENVDESGNVQFEQADRQATAAHATIARLTDTIRLEGSPAISDSMSRTTAANVTINQSSGEIHASGRVVSTYIPAAQNGAVGLSGGVANISADALSGSVHAGRVTYTGHARLWQGDAVLDSEQIEIWRDDQKLEATGHVVAVFPQASGPLASMPGVHSGSSSASESKPTLWKILAPSLTYWNDQGRAHFEGGVVARSDQGSLESRTLDAFLVTAAAAGGASGARELSRVLAQGSVVVREGDRRGTSERAEYTAAEGKFVLSGGRPTLANASSDTATGHSLTFFVANDTILVDSQEGLRTVTTHRVEK
jgi:lipopolysaccharide export system protein LptA